MHVSFGKMIKGGSLRRAQVDSAALVGVQEEPKADTTRPKHPGERKPRADRSALGDSAESPQGRIDAETHFFAGRNAELVPFEREGIGKRFEQSATTKDNVALSIGPIQQTRANGGVCIKKTRDIDVVG